MHSLSQRVLSQIRRQGLLKAGDRVGVAVSGGIDSVAMLRLMIELRHDLGIVLSVVHFNHKLRGAESDADEQFVTNLARAHHLEFHCDTDDVAQHATDERISAETAARELRYGFFESLLADAGCLGKIVTGHTLDDQAETVVMRLIRGTGMRGLGGIYPRISVEDDDGEICGEIVRPLLGIRRRELKAYLFDLRQEWREDSSNADDSFTRNRVRKLVLPVLEQEFNPAVAENLAELADIVREEEDYWENEAAGWMGTVVHWSEPDWATEALSRSGLVQIQNDNSSLVRKRIENAPWLVMNASMSRMWFLGEPLAAQRRLIKSIGQQAGISLEFKHVDEIIRFAGGSDSGKELSLPHGWKMVVQYDDLIFVTPNLNTRHPMTTDRRKVGTHGQAVPQDYEYELPLPGCAIVSEAGTVFEARCVPPGAEREYNSACLLDAASLPGPLRVRNWRPGDRFWPAHSKSPKKIKELLQERHLPQPGRRLWPVVLSGDDIVWVRGFPHSERFRARPGRDAILIEEKALPRNADRNSR